jgi:hypothetical protein
MIGFKVTFPAVKDAFFDRAAVLAAADRMAVKVLSKFGAYVRRTAKGLIYKAQAPSQPGKPPHSQTGILRKFILFSWDDATRSVVIGPSRLNIAVNNGQPVPGLLEAGGEASYSTAWLRHGRPIFEGRGRRRHLVRYEPLAGRTYRMEPRPYMGPAYQKELPKLPDMWRDALGR